MSLREQKDFKHRIMKTKNSESNGPGFGEERDGPYQNDVARFMKVPLRRSFSKGRVVSMEKKEPPESFLRSKNGAFFESKTKHGGDFFCLGSHTFRNMLNSRA